MKFSNQKPAFVANELRDLVLVSLTKRLRSKYFNHLLCNWPTWKWGEVNLLFNVTIYDISVIYVTAHRCAGGLKKKLNLRSGSQRHRHFVGFFNVPVQTPTRDHPFYTVITLQFLYTISVSA